MVTEVKRKLASHYSDLREKLESLNMFSMLIQVALAKFTQPQDLRRVYLLEKNYLTKLASNTEETRVDVDIRLKNCLDPCTAGKFYERMQGEDGWMEKLKTWWRSLTMRGWLSIMSKCYAWEMFVLFIGMIHCVGLFCQDGFFFVMFKGANLLQGPLEGWSFENRDLYGPKWHLLRSMPFQATQKSRFSGPTPSNGPCNGPNGIFRGLGETDSGKKPEVENLVALSL
jgi:hypothetical protein